VCYPAHFYRLKDENGEYYATEGDYEPPQLALAGWDANYEMIPKLDVPHIIRLPNGS
jgi:hypothetical protein